MSEAKDFNNILIVGLGLIGGSIAKKLKDISYPGKVFGLDKDIDTIKKAHQDLLITNDNSIHIDTLDELLFKLE